MSPFRARRVSYSGALDLTRRLAKKLESIPAELKTATYMAVPRGGLVVLGLLSYWLRLSPEQFESKSSAPLVLVDDCLLSGARTQQFLQTIPHQQIILAHLLSVPAARKAALTQEPRIIDCIAADDLEIAQELSGEQLTLWRDLMRDKGYWWGFPRPVFFPWAEPDRIIWNARKERVESGWHEASPNECLEVLVELDLPIEDWPDTEIQLSPGTIWRLEGGEALLKRQQDNQTFGLDQVATEMLKAALGYGRKEGAIDYLVSRFDATPSQIRADFEEFLASMEARGLLRRPLR